MLFELNGFLCKIHSMYAVVLASAALTACFPSGLNCMHLPFNALNGQQDKTVIWGQAFEGTNAREIPFTKGKSAGRDLTGEGGYKNAHLSARIHPLCFSFSD